MEEADLGSYFMWLKKEIFYARNRRIFSHTGRHAETVNL